MERLRVLFLGSSLTYANDMPGIVQALARSVGETLDVAQVSRGGASLEDQWNQGSALSKIKAGKWDVVVLQQGPSSTPENRKNLRHWTRRFADPIRKAGGRPALYMVWPGLDRFDYFDEVRESYTSAAEDVDGMLFPAGEAWRAVLRRDSKVALYKRDGVHPTPAGSLTVALSIFGILYGCSPLELPARAFAREKVAPALLPLLQEATAEANERFGKR
jgi:hypothetical protein